MFPGVVLSVPVFPGVVVVCEVIVTLPDPEPPPVPVPGPDVVMVELQYEVLLDVVVGGGGIVGSDDEGGVVSGSGVVVVVDVSGGEVGHGICTVW